MKNQLFLFDKKAVVHLKTDIIYSKIGEEVVLINEDSGKYLRVDPIGSTIWELLKNPITVDKLCLELANQYEVTEEQCYKDVCAFLNQLNKDTLLNVE